MGPSLAAFILLSTAFSLGPAAAEDGVFAATDGPQAPDSAVERRDLPRSRKVMVDVGTKTLSGYDELSFLGWNNACSVGLRYLSFGPTGTNLGGVPQVWRIGAVTLPPDRSREAPRWLFQNGAAKWDRQAADAAVASLARAGYEVFGPSERIRDAAVAEQPGLARILRTTAPFELGYAIDWPAASYDLAAVHYSPLGSCVFAVFRDRSRPMQSFDFRLFRIQNPGARRERARAHVANGLILFDLKGDLYGAAEELEIAARMAPDFAVARFHNARMQSLHGRFDAAFTELTAAIAREPKYRREALEDFAFEAVREDPRFRSITAEKPSKFP